MNFYTVQCNFSGLIFIDYIKCNVIPPISSLLAHPTKPIFPDLPAKYFGRWCPQPGQPDDFTKCDYVDQCSNITCSHNPDYKPPIT